MKISRYFIGLTVVLMALIGCKEQAAQEPASDAAVVSSASAVSLDSLEDRVSYLMGYSLAKQVEESGLDINDQVLIKAIEDVQNNAEPMLNGPQLRQVNSEFQRLIQERQVSSTVNNNIKQGEEYRQLNAKRDGVEQTPLGVQYEVLVGPKEGAKKPTREDRVKVNYHGTLINGKVFDSSVDKEAPVTFGVTEVIRGWTEVLQLMSEGEKWRVVIPGDLAYPNGTRTIPPASTLIFEIELLEINPSE